MRKMVSVVIPFYNRKSLVSEALNSVLSQTHKDSEIVLVDDGSTDGAAEYLENRLRSRDKFLVLDHSGFPGLVRNRGVEAANGEFLAFLDSDDLWLPEKLEKQLTVFERNSECVLVHTRERWLRDGLTVSQKGQKHKREGDVFSDALKKCIIGPSTVMMKRDVYHQFGGFREDLEIAEDYEFWLRLTSRYSVGYLDEPLTVKRAGHGEQLSEKYGQIEVFRLKALMDLIGKNEWSSVRQKEAIAEAKRKAGIYAAGCRKRNRLEEAEFYERWAQSV